MGCDIHMVVQVFKGDRWETVPVPNLDYDPNSKYDWEREPMVYAAFSDRNYSLFSILANVRNGYGFAGVSTGTGFIPIADNRGFPNDFKMDEDGYCDEHRGMWMGDHSKTWVTLEELLNYDWNQITTKTGVIRGTEYKRMLAMGDVRPRAYCGGISGGGIKHVTIKELEELVETEPDETLGQYCASFQWALTYWEAAGRFYTRFIPMLQQLGKPEDVRLVMGFDS